MTLSKILEFAEVSGPEKSKSENFVSGLNMENISRANEFKAWAPAGTEHPINLPTEEFEDIDQDKISDADDLASATADIVNTMESIQNADSGQTESGFTEGVSELNNEDDCELENSSINDGYYTKEEYEQFGEEQYLLGYKACKENEEMEFGERTAVLDKIIHEIKENNADVSNFYEPIKNLITRAIEAIMQVDLKESKRSVEKIVQSLISEIEVTNQDQINIYLNPADELVVKKYVESEGLKTVSDQRLEKGSVKITLGDKTLESIKKSRVEEIVNKILIPAKK